MDEDEFNFFLNNRKHRLNDLLHDRNTMINDLITFVKDSFDMLDKNDDLEEERLIEALKDDFDTFLRFIDQY